MQGIPKSAEIDIDSLSELAVDCWRLSKWINQKESDDSLVVHRHVLRRLIRFMETSEISTIDLTGQPFDVGLAAEVIDIVNDQELAEGSATICETVNTIVMWKGIAVKHAQVVVRQNSIAAIEKREDEKS